MRLRADDAGERAAGAGVEFLGHAARFVGEASGFDAELHGARHSDGVFGGGDGGVHEHAIGAQFHGDGGVAGGAHAGVHDDGDFGNHLAEDAQIGRVLDAESGTDGGGERHDGGGAGIDQAAGV